jgi:hypothetical protein
MAPRLEGVPLFGFVCGDGEESVGVHGEGHVSVPGVVLPDLVLRDDIKAVVAVADGRRVFGSALPPADQSDWQSLFFRSNETPVPANVEGLIANLSPGARLTAPFTGVDNPVSLVAVVDVSTGNDDRVRALLGIEGFENPA